MTKLEDLTVCNYRRIATWRMQFLDLRPNQFQPESVVLENVKKLYIA
jgi:hypothetical protein